MTEELLAEISILKEKIKQLEQVVRDIYNSAWTSEFLRIDAEMPDADRELKERVADGWLQNERDKLRELGVSTDE